MSEVNSIYELGAAGSKHRSQADRERAQLAIDKSRGDLSEVLFNANRKRKVFGEEVQARRERTRSAFGAAAFLSACTVGATLCAALQPAFAVPAYFGATVLGLLATASFSYAFKADTNASTATLVTDVNLCSVILQQMRDLQVDDEHALESGQRKLSAYVARFGEICNRHLDVSKFEFEKSRRHQRYKTSRTFEIVSASGSKATFKGMDISRSGIAVETNLSIREGAEVTIGSGTKAKMVRRIKGGLAFEFLTIVPAHQFSVDMRL